MHAGLSPHTRAGAAVTTFPPSDHCDGSVFFNPAVGSARPTATRGILPVLRWRLSGSRSRWPDHIDDPPPTGDPRATPPPSAAGVTFIGHSSFHLRLGALSVLTDPIWSERCSPLSWAGPRRVRAPGRRLDDLPRIDLVLVSHNHYDHLDLPSLRRVAARDDPLFLTPLGNAPLLARAGARRVVELDWWDTHSLPGGARITAVPARHFSARTLRDRNRALWCGFSVAWDGHHVLFAGDSASGPHWAAIRARLGPPDLALLPIGAYAPRWFMAAVHMDPDEAVTAHQELGARRSVGMHFGTFQLTDEPVGEPETRLAAAAAATGLAPGVFTTLGFGETRHIGLDG
jgi:L-ascorbate metabolism protein UlaG (beta-lactamase superfamily)